MAALPDVSVVIPTFNAERTIARALKSALEQSHENIEVVVVDDASQDATVTHAEAFAANDARVRVIPLANNGGPGRARNIGMTVARGEWIALLDADDAWKPERVDLLLTLSQTAGADIVFDNLLGFDMRSGKQTQPLFPRLPSSIDLLSMIVRPKGAAFDYGYLKPMLRAAKVRSAGLSYDETLRTSEDLLFYLECLALRLRTAASPLPLYIYSLPVTASGHASPHSHTKPADLEVAERLLQFERRHASSLTGEERSALIERAESLRKLAPLSHFYHARRHSQRMRMLVLFLGSFHVQREVAGKLWRKSLRIGRRSAS